MRNQKLVKIFDKIIVENQLKYPYFLQCVLRFSESLLSVPLVGTVY